MRRVLSAVVVCLVIYRLDGVSFDAQSHAAQAFDGAERVVVLLGDGPYFSGLYHRNWCWWIARGSRQHAMSRSEADAAYFTAHGECFSKPVGGNNTAPKNAPPSNAPSGAFQGQTADDREMVSVRLSTPYLNGLYHRVGCWWLTRAGVGEVRTLQRGDAERRHFDAHLECMNKPPLANSTPPPEFAEKTAVRRGQVDLASFGRIELGMSLTDVETLLGGPGKADTQSESATRTFAIYTWETSDGFAMVSFRDGRVSSKHQSGLK